MSTEPGYHGDLADAKITVEAYQKLLDRALGVVGYSTPYTHTVDIDDCPSLEFDEDEVLLKWKTCEAGYYGSIDRSEESYRFPAWALFTPIDQLRAIRTQHDAIEKERKAKVQAAEMAVAKDRREKQDRAEYARLWNKFGGKPLD